MLSLQAIYRYNIDLSFGIDEEVPYETISANCGLNVIDLRRILRYAMTNHIFREPRAGFVAHTALSRVLAQNSRLRDYIGMVCEERFPASARVKCPDGTVLHCSYSGSVHSVYRAPRLTVVSLSCRQWMH